MMIGLVKLAGDLDPSTYERILAETNQYRLKVRLILHKLAGGWPSQCLITRKESAKNLWLPRRFDTG
jgi:hypothetical protein